MSDRPAETVSPTPRRAPGDLALPPSLRVTCYVVAAGFLVVAGFLLAGHQTLRAVVLVCQGLTVVAIARWRAANGRPRAPQRIRTPLYVLAGLGVALAIASLILGDLWSAWCEAYFAALAFGVARTAVVKAGRP